MKTVSIRTKIILLSAVPFLALLFFVQREVRDALRERTELRNIHERILLAEKVSDVVHELQRERGLSVLFLSSRGRAGEDRLREQAAATDKAVEALGAFLNKRRGDLRTMSLFSGLDGQREQVLSLEVSLFEAEDGYTALIHELLDEVTHIAQTVQLPKIRTILFAHASLLDAKEALSQLRASLSAALSAEAPEGARRERIYLLKRAYERNTRNFLQETTEGVRGFYDQRFRGPAVERTLETIDRAVQGRPTGIEPGAWFDAATVVVNILKDIEGYGMEAIKQEALQSVEKAAQRIRVNLVLVPAVLMVAAGLGIVVCTTILGRLDYLKKDMTSIVEMRDFSARVEVRSKDEIGVISQAFNTLLDRVRETTAELERLSETDNLTQLYNRLKFNELLKLEVRRAHRYQSPLSLIMFDIDHFKRINDLWGHLAGDAVLVELAQTVKEQLRTTDVLARWGGEEFVILAVETGIEGALTLAEKIRGAIEGHSFREGVETGGNVTCSFGVTEYREGDDLDALSRRADEALYDAKRSGRNRVCRR